MTEAELVTLITAAGAAIAGGARWALRLWATVRREAIAAAKEASAAQRADNERMIQALLEQARSNAQLAGRIDQLTTKLDTLVEWRDRTPVEGYPAVDEHPSERRNRTNPHGYRPPARGHDD
jgi:hypothetical protein